MAKRHTRHRRQKRHRRRSMKGGAFSEQELQQLEDYGFSEQQINSLTDLGASFNEVMQKVNTIMNNGDGSYMDPDYVTEQVMVQLLNEHMLDTIPHADDDIHELDIGMDDSFNSQGTMNLDELNTSDISNTSGETTNQDISFGGKKRRRISRKKIKKRRERKTRKNRKLKFKGGMCFGNGVGANSYDPNYSIYNTNMLKLFPYKP
jgi:hypothetical protein